MSLGIVINVYKETDTLKQALESIQNIGYDELHIALSTDYEPTEKICRQYTDNIYHCPEDCFITTDKGIRRYSFGAGRNFILSKCLTDWVLYIDADDVLVGGEHIKGLIEEAEKLGESSIRLNYQFTFKDDEMTRPTLILTNKRIFKHNHFWKGVAFEKLHGEGIGMFSDKSYMKHNHKWMRKEKLDRNVIDAEDDFKKNPCYDTTYSLAQAHHDVNNIRQALKYYNETLKYKMEDYVRYRIMLACSELYMIQGKYDAAKTVARAAGKVFKDEALWVFQCALVYCLEKKYNKAINMYSQGFGMKQPVSSIFYFKPEAYNYNPAINFYNCLYITGRKMEAYMVIGELLLKYPKDEELLKLRETLWRR